MKLTNSEQLQSMIDNAPKQHAKLPYKVLIKDKRDNKIDHFYVLASSPYRARLTGLKVHKFHYRKRGAAGATAIPDGWKESQLINGALPV